PRLDRLRRTPTVLADRRRSERQPAIDADAGRRDFGAGDEPAVDADRILDLRVTCGRGDGDAGQPRGSLHVQSLHDFSSKKIARRAEGRLRMVLSSAARQQHSNPKKVSTAAARGFAALS